MWQKRSVRIIVLLAAIVLVGWGELMLLVLLLSSDLGTAVLEGAFGLSCVAGVVAAVCSWWKGRVEARALAARQYAERLEATPAMVEATGRACFGVLDRRGHRLVLVIEIADRRLRIADFGRAPLDAESMVWMGHFGHIAALASFLARNQENRRVAKLLDELHNSPQRALRDLPLRVDMPVSKATVAMLNAKKTVITVSLGSSTLANGRMLAGDKLGFEWASPLIAFAAFRSLVLDMGGSA